MTAGATNVAWDRVLALVEGARASGAEVGVAARWLATGERWESGGGQPFPAASTIKLAILVACYQEVDAGTLDLDRPVAVAPNAIVGGTGVLVGLRPGLRLPVEDLLYLMVAISDNTASNLLIDVVGRERVQQTIADLGLTGTALNRRFLGRTPGSGDPENFATASDLVALLAAIARDEAASAANCARMRDVLALQQDRDRLARRLPEGVAFAGKSGSLPGIVHDAGLLTTADDTVAVAVLTRGIADRYLADELIGRVGQAVVRTEG